MRIIFITSSDTPSGGARQAMYLAHGLAALGHHITFFVPEKSPLPDLSPPSDGVTWCSLPPRNGTWKKEWRLAVENVLIQPENNTQPTIVHAFHNKAVKLLSWWGIGWRKQGAVCVAHRGVVFRPGNPLPYMSPGIAAFVVNSKACADVLAPYCLGRKRIHVVYNGIPDERTVPDTAGSAIRAELGIPEHARVLGSVMNDNPNKGLDIVIKAMAQIKQAGTHEVPHTVVVGINYPEWMEMAEELGVAEYLHCVPGTENVANYLNVMDGFILPSRSESMPNTLMEAIRMGLPCAGTRVGGVPELLEGVGKLIPPEDPTAMANAMLELAYDDDLRATWTAASNAAAANYTVSARSAKIERLYQRLLQQRGYSIQ